MKNFKTVIRQEVIKLICDGCGLKASVDEGYEFSECITIEHRCGYGAIHGDGKQLSIDLCQDCFAGMCGDVLTVIDPVDNQSIDSPEESLEYNTIFQAISPSKQEANEMKQQSDTRISARDILSANTISNQEELLIALKRVEQLWDAQCPSVEGKELQKLTDLIYAYENKSWDSYFAQGPLDDDNFMSERLSAIEGLPLEESEVASGILADTPVNKEIDEDDSRHSTLMKKILIKEKCISQVEPKIAKALLETIEKAWAKYPDLRLTQLLLNVIKPSESCAEIYYVENSRLIELLNEFIGEEAESHEVSANAIDELLMLHIDMLAFFNSKEDVDTWMHTKATALGGEKPISLLPTTQGRKTLKQILNRMKQGDF